MVILNPVFGAGTVVIFTGMAIIFYGISYIVFGVQLKKVKQTVGDIKKAILGDFEDLKKEVIATIKDAQDSMAGASDVEKKLDSFKDELSDSDKD